MTVALVIIALEVGFVLGLGLGNILMRWELEDAGSLKRSAERLANREWREPSKVTQLRVIH